MALGLALWATVAFPPREAAARTYRQGGLWVLENPQVQVRVDPRSGRVGVLDRASGREWRQPAPEEGGWPVGPHARFRKARALAAPADGVAFEVGGPQAGGASNPLLVTFSIPAEGADLVIEADVADRSARTPPRPFMDFFVLDTSQPVLVVSDQSNGHLYPLDADPFPVAVLEASRLDMPWFGVCDMETGAGYAVFLETSDDAVVRCDSVRVAGRRMVVPRLVWLPSLGTFGYGRRLVCRFFAEGGYVAQAKAYRARAAEQGLLVTLAEKARKNPEVERLFGAADVWDGDLAFAREASAAGVAKMLFQANLSPEDLAAVKELGYLTSTYDNYSDVLPLAPGGSVDASHDLLPDHAVLPENGRRLPSHVDWKRGTQYERRCPRFWLPAAEAAIPAALADHPYGGRFLDVITAQSPLECFDPAHPVTRADYRRLAAGLLDYVASQNLVVGGEMGIWWAVPQLAYAEGMMSGGYRYYAWPAGQLVRPRSRDEAFTSPQGVALGASWTDYDTWGIGPEHRAPLWELVFHDCLVTTWYWGDASDWLLQAAPELTARKDAFNVLYGTMPLLWAGRAGNSWTTARDVFLRTCRTVCPLHQAVAGTEMLSHEFLTPDRAVQRTRFANGVAVVVNFGEAPREIELEGLRHLLPADGFAAKGPDFEEFRELVNGQIVTTVQGARIE